MEPIQLSLSSSQGNTSPGHKPGLLQGGHKAPTTHKSTNPVGCCTGYCCSAQNSAFIPGALGVSSAPRGVQEALLRPLQETLCVTGVLEKYQWDHVHYGTRVI